MQLFLKTKGCSMEIIKKIGGYKKAVEVLISGGWKVKQPYGLLVLQCHRKNLSKEASLILWDYCLKNNIPVSINDFKEQ